MSMCVVMEWGTRSAGVVLVPWPYCWLKTLTLLRMWLGTAGCRWGWGMDRQGYRENTPFLEGGGRDALPSDPA